MATGTRATLWYCLAYTGKALYQYASKKNKTSTLYKRGKKGNMKKIILGNIISNIIWVVTVTVGVIGVALFIDEKK